jgi:HNH endonuclease
MAQNRARTHEIRPIPFAPGYFVREDGAVFSERPKNGSGRQGPRRQLRYSRDEGGYRQHQLMINKRARPRRVHLIVALTFLGPRPSPNHEIRHLDGNRENNHHSNLAWGTAKENADDRDRHGRTARWDKNAQAKLTRAQVSAIRNALSKGARGGVLAQKYAVSASVISGIKLGRTWRGLQ